MMSEYHPPGVPQGPSPLPSIIDYTGEVRLLGNLPSPGHLVSAVPTWTAAGNDVMPESEWKEFDYTDLPVKIKDQDGKGACNGHAAATSLELARNVAGKPHVSLSAWYVYAILCQGWDRGSNILDALALLSAQGTCPEPDMPYGEIHPSRITAAAKTSAARFKLEAGFSLKSWPEIMTAVQLLRPLNLSIQVGNAFNNLDAEGVPGASRGPGNHAVCVGFGAKKSAKHGWLIKMWNSWGTVWGLNGFCWIGQAHTDGVSYFEAYDVVTSADDPTDPTNPPHGS